MQSKRIIIGASIIILLSFSFSKCYCLSSEICSRNDLSNCQDLATERSVYHQYEKYLNGNNHEIDVRRERLLQIRSVDQRDLFTTNKDRIRVSREGLESRERTSDRERTHFRDSRLFDRNRERITPNLSERIQSSRTRDRISNLNLENRERNYKVLERQTRTNERDRENNREYENRKRNSQYSRNTETPEKQLKTTERSRENSEIREERSQYSRIRENIERQLKINARSFENNRNIQNSRERNSRIFARVSNSRENNRNSENRERKVRISERVLNVRDFRNRQIYPERQLETTDRNRDNRNFENREQNLRTTERFRQNNFVNERTQNSRTRKTFSERQLKSTERIQNNQIRERDLKITNRVSERIPNIQESQLFGHTREDANRNLEQSTEFRVSDSIHRENSNRRLFKLTERGDISNRENRFSRQSQRSFSNVPKNIRIIFENRRLSERVNRQFRINDDERIREINLERNGFERTFRTSERRSRLPQLQSRERLSIPERAVRLSQFRNREIRENRIIERSFQVREPLDRQNREARNADRQLSRNLEQTNDQRIQKSDRRFNSRDLNSRNNEISVKREQREDFMKNNKHNLEINRRHGEQNGFRYFDQREINVFRVVFPKNKVQELYVENQTIWTNAAKIILVCLLIWQISRNKPENLKLFKKFSIPKFSQIIKEKVQ